jgi:chemotaxis methyl-accepting protein methylase
MDDARFKKLLDLFDLSWQGCRRVRKGVKKRLSRHMHEIGCRDVDDYLDRIKAHPPILQETQRLMTVSVSSFFRDRLLWKLLEERLIPGFVGRNIDCVHVWSAGCALGQEVYSFKILWSLAAKKSGSLPPLHILATDLNPEYVVKAVEGIFSSRAIRAVPPEILESSFRGFENHYAVSDHLKTDISWEISDLTNPPRARHRFQIIFIRNSLLTYYKQEIIEAVFPRIVDSLAHEGYLIIGARENLPHAPHHYFLKMVHPCVFQFNPASFGSPMH